MYLEGHHVGRVKGCMAKNPATWVKAAGATNVGFPHYDKARSFTPKSQPCQPSLGGPSIHYFTIPRLSFSYGKQNNSLLTLTLNPHMNPAIFAFIS